MVPGIRAGQSGGGRSATRHLADRGAVPGFTRGLDFCGPLAFIGLSQVRESAVFSGIPLVERLPGAHLRGVGGAHRDGRDGRLSAL